MKKQIRNTVSCFQVNGKFDLIRLILFVYLANSLLLKFLFKKWKKNKTKQKNKKKKTKMLYNFNFKKKNQSNELAYKWLFKERKNVVKYIKYKKTSWKDTWTILPTKASFQWHSEKQVFYKFALVITYL